MDFDQNCQPITRDYPGPVSTNYTVKTGDTLYSIARAVWGDSAMWYLIADANGLSADADLTAEQVIRIPNKVTNIHNNNTTIRPYSAGETMGDTSPTLPDAPAAPIPAPQSKKKCGALAKIVAAAIVVVATIYTAGLAANVAAGRWGAAFSGGFAGTMTAGAAALEAGSLGIAAMGAVGAARRRGLETGSGLTFGHKLCCMRHGAGRILHQTGSELISGDELS